MRLIVPCLLLTACSASGVSGALGVLGLVLGGWLLLTPRGASGDMLPDASMGADGGADARPDPKPPIGPCLAPPDPPGSTDADLGPCLAPPPEPGVQSCLCVAQPGAALPEPATMPGFDPIRVKDRVLAALPPDVRARLED